MPGNTLLKGAETLAERPALDRLQTASSGPAGLVTEIQDDGYVTGKSLYMVLLGILLSVLLIAIDQTIVANALPLIASAFNALSQLAWVPTSFLLTQASFLLIYGQLTLLFPSKWVFIWALVLFEIGSLLSGVATSVNFLIFARAFQGVGAAGVFVLPISMVAELVPLKNRAMCFSAFGGVFAISSIIVYINLPLSIPTFIAVFLCTKAKPPLGLAGQKPTSVETADPSKKSLLVVTWLSLKGSCQKMTNLDWIGAILVLGFTTCLGLALQWGGNTKPWNSGGVIATFVVFGVLVILFVLWQRYKGDKALLPLSLFRRLTIVGCCICAFSTRMAFFTAVYYLPLYFQVVKGHSAIKSGIDLLPLVLAVVSTFAAGSFIVSKTGRVWHILLLGPLVGAICFGLLNTMDEDTGWGKLIGLQIGVGIGVGCTLQNAVLAAQAAVHKELVSQASALVTFSSFIGGILGVSIAGTIFQNKLASGLLQFAPEAPYALLRHSIEAIATLPANQKAGAIHAYVEALKLVFVAMGVSANVICSLSALMIENTNLKKMSPVQAGEGEKEDELDADNGMA
ncbi:hypothetical protein BOTBODRAFT_183202 [Botryobasidium botryosum FD-172 SS1]|uniref:Major facilitator superfamily (MFS) profile domain-containing protein n=1 Tax=Botryobasidium botryosum (strain FD-172 SS1) TaxID=930990 RepID=A0A067MXT9_BOTB1|nr:hypothetical protein BOTBODRAFT_183202 [Botryobasidium botryosum FD-172 SS1]